MVWGFTFAEGLPLSGDNRGYVVQPIAADQPSSDFPMAVSSGLEWWARQNSNL
jgi:hypothetical protein